jgi:hypothetical protein
MDPDSPVYQVTIFERLSEPADVSEEQRGHHAHEWKLHDADVTEVLAWAKDKAGTNDYSVEVASVIDDGDSYLIHLYGQNPLRSSGPSEVFQLAPDVIPDKWDFIKRQRDGQ